MTHSNKIDWRFIWGKCACNSVQNIHFLNKNIDIEIQNYKIFAHFYQGSEIRKIWCYRHGTVEDLNLWGAAGRGRVFVASEDLRTESDSKKWKKTDNEKIHNFSLHCALFKLSNHENATCVGETLDWQFAISALPSNSVLGTLFEDICNRCSSFKVR